MNRAINTQVNNIACISQHCFRFNGRAIISCQKKNTNMCKQTNQSADIHIYVQHKLIYVA